DGQTHSPPHPPPLRRIPPPPRPHARRPPRPPHHTAHPRHATVGAGGNRLDRARPPHRLPPGHRGQVPPPRPPRLPRQALPPAHGRRRDHPHVLAPRQREGVGGWVRSSSSSFAALPICRFHEPEHRHHRSHRRRRPRDADDHRPAPVPPTLYPPVRVEA